MSYFLIMGILGGLKFWTEGMRITSLVQLLIFAFQIALSRSQFRQIIVLFFSSLNFVLTKRFTVYQLPTPSGIYPVGYREVPLENKSYEICVYYPCKLDPENPPRMAKWLNFDRFWTFIHATTDKDRENPGKVPRWFFFFSYHYLKRMLMGAYQDAEIIDLKDLVYESRFFNLRKPLRDGFPVFYLSLGLACHKNNYSSLAKELASKGCIVFSVFQEEGIRNPKICRAENRKFRIDQLEERYSYMKDGLDQIFNESVIERTFGKKVQFNPEQVSAMGHSFGGISSIYIAWKDKRITGVCLSMDPPLFGLPDEFSATNVYPSDLNDSNRHLQRDLEIPFFALNTETFYPRLWRFFDEFERMDKFYHCQGRHHKSNWCVYLRNLAHANFLDHSLISAGEFDTYNVIERGHDPLPYMRSILILNELFVETHLILRDEFRDQDVSFEALYPKIARFIQDAKILSELRFLRPSQPPIQFDFERHTHERHFKKIPEECHCFKPAPKNPRLLSRLLHKVWRKSRHQTTHNS